MTSSSPTSTCRRGCCTVSTRCRRPPMSATASTAHDPSEDIAVRHDDPDFAIAWPLPVSTVSARDARAPSWRSLRPDDGPAIGAKTRSASSRSRSAVTASLTAAQCAGSRPSGKSSSVSSSRAGAQSSASAARSSSSRTVPPPVTTRACTVRSGRCAHRVSRLPRRRWPDRRGARRAARPARRRAVPGRAREQVNQRGTAGSHGCREGQHRDVEASRAGRPRCREEGPRSPGVCVPGLCEGPLHRSPTAFCACP
jgi:hypothetical protein